VPVEGGFLSGQVFFFGTLLHAPLLEAVVGDAAHLGAAPAVLPGFRVEAAAEGPFPVIFRDPAGSVEGQVLSGLRSKDLARLDFYEGAFDYARAPATLENGGQAEVYLPPDARFSGNGQWDFAQWVETWGALSVIAAREVMGWYGRRPAAEIGRMFPTIRARAASTLRAGHSLHGALTMKGQVEIAQRRHVYAEHFALDELQLRHSRFDGSMSDLLDRAVFRPPDAALVMPYDPVRDRVLLVEQVRVGPLVRGDRRVWQLEPIAGHIDPGESPEEAARREALEEANIALETLEPVAQSYTSPGNSTEFSYLFVALADLPDARAGQGGLDCENEDIRSHLVSFERLMELCDSQQIGNAPLLVASYWLARHRARLRT
jgi:nudix-type nucleoside diphosphatase (YffH/AdpP family)